MSYKRKIVIALVTLICLVAGYFLFMEEQGNFHAITAGEAYRSAQMDRDELQYYLRTYHIKSILNLRGRNPDSSWYREEIQTCAEQKVMHFDIALSASSAPDNEQLREMIAIFKSAPRPILIHCRAGADRSGLAAAIWKVVVDRQPKREAAKQLSLLYGHFPVGPTTVLDHFFENWAPASQ